MKYLILASCLAALSIVCATGQKALRVSNDTYDVLEKVSQSALADGEVLLSLTTHQDLGWIDEIENCVVMRDTLWITPLFAAVEGRRGIRDGH